MSSTIARKDFEIYAKGVKQLEELEKEVKLLNVEKKFPAEVASIRSKLKHVSEIPQIEYEIKALKDKISNKPRKVIKHSSVNEGKIKELKSEIQRKAALCKKFAPLSKEVVKLKLEIESMRKKIKLYESEKQRKTALLDNINIGVSKVFDDTFNLSLNEIKAKLSKEVENKEAEVQKELQRDLERREEVFNEKYSQLEEEFHKNYNQKVKKELDNKVKEEFNDILKTELEKRNKLSQLEVDNLKRKLKTEFAIKEKALREHFDKDISEEKKALKENFVEGLLAQKVKLHKKLDSELAKEIVKIKQKEGEKEHELAERKKFLGNLREKLIQSFSKKRESLEVQEQAKLEGKLREVETEKKEYFKKMQQKQENLEKNKERFNSLKNKIIAKTREELEQEKKEIENQKIRDQQRIAKREEALRKKGEELKALLKKEFEEKLKEAIKAKESELRKKNLELEKEIKDKVRMFYK